MPDPGAYARFTAIGRKYMAEGMERQEAYSKAVEYCIEHDILKEFLQKNKSEVVGMLVEEFDQVPQRIVEKITTQNSIDVLSRWFKSAKKAESISEFEANM